MSLLRKLKSGLTIGVLWGATSATASVLLDLLTLGYGRPFMEQRAVHYGLSGFAAGAVFSVLLALAERGSRGLSVVRGAAWGFVAWAIALPSIMKALGAPNAFIGFLVPSYASMVFSSALIGAALGALTAWVAGRDEEAPRDPGLVLELESAREPSPLERDLADDKSTRPQEVL